MSCPDVAFFNGYFSSSNLSSFILDFFFIKTGGTTATFFFSASSTVVTFLTIFGAAFFYVFTYFFYDFFTAPDVIRYIGFFTVLESFFYGAYIIALDFVVTDVLDYGAFAFYIFSIVFRYSLPS